MTNPTERQLCVHVLNVQRWSAGRGQLGAVLQTMFVSGEPTRWKRSTGKLLKMRQRLMCEWSRGGTGSPRFPQMWPTSAAVPHQTADRRGEERTNGWSRVHQPPNRDPAVLQEDSYFQMNNSHYKNQNNFFLSCQRYSFFEECLSTFIVHGFGKQPLGANVYTKCNPAWPPTPWIPVWSVFNYLVSSPGLAPFASLPATTFWEAFAGK